MEKSSNKPLWAKLKHLKALQGTGFEKCANCAGTAGKVSEDGTMPCSKAGAIPMQVTASQAQVCDGTNPIAEKSEHVVHPVFLRRAPKPVDYRVLVSA